MASSEQPLLFLSRYAAPDEPGIYVYSFDEATGALTLHGSFAGIANPAFVVIHPNGRWLYAVSETSEANDGAPGAVWALQFQRDPFSIQTINHQPSGGDLPCHLQFDATAQWLFVSNYGSGSAAVLPIQSDGSLGKMTDHVQHQGSGPHRDRQEGPHAHSTTLTPDNRFAIVADLGIDQLVSYEFDPMAGKLHPHLQTQTRPGAGPRHLAFHPNDRVVYVANELDNTVAAYDYYSESGALRERQIVATVPPSVSENTAADIHTSSGGNRVYVSNRGHNSIAVFDANGNGQLTHLAYASCGGNWPRNFALAPGEPFMLVANQYSGDVSVLLLPVGSDEIGAAVTRVTVPKASCVKFLQTHD